MRAIESLIPTSLSLKKGGWDHPPKTHNEDSVKLNRY